MNRSAARFRRLSTALMFVAASAIPVLAQGANTPCVLDRCDHPITSGAAPSTAPAPSAPAPATPDAESEPAAPRAPEPSSTGSGGAFRRGNAASGNFDFYVLALSWSPSFCATPAGERASEQCAAGANLGFVVHGLWPQNEHGWPHDCSSSQFPTRAQIESVHGVYPDDGLARHEWRAHGACTGKSPTDYFADVRRARQSITIPDAFANAGSEQRAAPAAIARSFMAANRGLRIDEMAVTCRAGNLEEVRICFSKDLRQFRPCPEVSRAACRSAQVAVPAPN